MRDCCTCVSVLSGTEFQNTEDFTIQMLFSQWMENTTITKTLKCMLCGVLFKQKYGHKHRGVLTWICDAAKTTKIGQYSNSVSTLQIMRSCRGVIWHHSRSYICIVTYRYRKSISTLCGGAHGNRTISTDLTVELPMTTGRPSPPHSAKPSGHRLFHSATVSRCVHLACYICCLK